MIKCAKCPPTSLLISSILNGFYMHSRSPCSFCPIKTPSSSGEYDVRPYILGMIFYPYVFSIIFFDAAKPSMTGIFKSINISMNGFSSPYLPTASTASCPLFASSVSIFSLHIYPNKFFINALVNISSSTINILVWAYPFE